MANTTPIFISPDQDKASQAAFLNENFRRLNDELSINNFDSQAIALTDGNPSVVADSSASSHGIKIDNTGLYACADGQGTTDANVRITTDGNVYLKGQISAGTGDIGGWVIGTDSLTSSSGTVGMSSAVTAGDDIRFWAGHATPASAPFYVTEAGSLIASAGGIGGWTISATSITASGGSVGMDSTESTDGVTDDMRFWAGNVDTALAPFSVTKSGALKATSATIEGALVATSGSIIASSYLDGAIALSNMDIASQGWSQTCILSSTSNNIVSWAAGAVATADNVTYTIDAGNTGYMVGRTFIYFDLNVSTTSYQITSDSTAAVGTGKILVATAINGTNGATFQVFGGVGGFNVDGSAIIANSITGNEIAANSITADELSVTSLDAISANMGHITGGTITLDATGYIKGGQTNFDTGTGFFLGVPTGGGAPVFSIGNSSPTEPSLTWDGTALNIKGKFTTTAPLNIKTYTTATLPGLPADTTTNSPSANANV